MEIVKIYELVKPKLLQEKLVKQNVHCCNRFPAIRLTEHRHSEADARTN